MAEMIPNATPPAVPSRLRRLPGRSPSLRTRYVARATLWMDDTQIIQESVRYYTQEIQRFALADIQAVQFRRTPRGLVYNVILLVLVALPLFGLAATWSAASTSVGDRVAFGIIAGFFGVFLLVNTLRGATCRTTLTTALGPQVLPSLSRVRTARRALALIAANVAAVQGAWQPTDAAREVDRALVQTTTGPAAASTALRQATLQSHD